MTNANYDRAWIKEMRICYFYPYIRKKFKFIFFGNLSSQDRKGALHADK